MLETVGVHIVEGGCSGGRSRFFGLLLIGGGHFFSFLPLILKILLVSVFRIFVFFLFWLFWKEPMARLCLVPIQKKQGKKKQNTHTPKWIERANENKNFCLERLLEKTSSSVFLRGKK